MTTQDVTAVLSIGLERADYDTVRSEVHRAVVDFGLELLSQTQGVGWYDGKPEPCASFTVTGRRAGVNRAAQRVTNIAHTQWGEDCIGFVRMDVTGWRDSCQFPSRQLTHAR